jgi:hypothetical protein
VQRRPDHPTLKMPREREMRDGPVHLTQELTPLYARKYETLRACRERPCHRRSAQKCDDLAPFHVKHHVASAAGCWVSCAGAGITAASLCVATILGTSDQLTEQGPVIGGWASVRMSPGRRLVWELQHARATAWPIDGTWSGQSRASSRGLFLSSARLISGSRLRVAGYFCLGGSHAALLFHAVTNFCP